MTKAEKIKNAVIVIAAQCDGARAKDGVGFNAPDAAYGNAIAEVPAEAWTEEDCIEVREMLRKYHEQLADAGIDYDDLPKVDAPSRGRKAAQLDMTERAKRIVLEREVITNPRAAITAARRYGMYLAVRQDEILRLYSPRDSDLITAIKTLPRTLRGWDPDLKCWWIYWQTIPTETIAIVDRFGFCVAPSDRDALTTPREIKPAPKPINIWIDEDKIITNTPYDRDSVEEMRRIAGRKWDGEDKVNTFPLAAAGDVLRLADAFGWSMSDDTREQLSGTGEKLSQAIVASRATDTDLAVEGMAPGLQPYPFQRAGIEYALKTDRVMIADEMGLGKTLQAMCAVHLRGAFPALVVCPKAVRKQWTQEIKKFLPGRTSIEVTSKTKDVSGFDFVVVNYDIAKKMTPVLNEVKFESIILDESHFIKNPKAARSKAVIDLADGIDVRICLTGTPVLNRPVELTNQLSFLGKLDDFGGFWGFAKRYCDAHKDKYGWNLNGHSNLEALNARLRSTCFVRREKADVVKELPQLQRTTVTVEIDKTREYKKALTALRNEVHALREAASDPKHPDHGKATAAAMTLVGKVRKLTTDHKLSAALEWTKAFLDSDGKLVLFAHHRDAQAALYEGLSDYNPARITGNQSDTEREREIKRFWEDDTCRVIVCSMKAANMGINLQVASKVAFVEFAWHAAEMDQAEARVHRIGSEATSINSYWLVAENTIDECSVDLIEQKREIQNAVNDGDDDVESSFIAQLLDSI